MWLLWRATAEIRKPSVVSVSIVMDHIINLRNLSNGFISLILLLITFLPDVSVFKVEVKVDRSSI